MEAGGGPLVPPWSWAGSHLQISESIFEMCLTWRCCSFSSPCLALFASLPFSAIARATFLLCAPVASSSRSLGSVGVAASS